MPKLKFIMLSLAFLFICFETNAQRVKNESTEVAYNRLPDKPLSSDFTTYSASVRTQYDVLSKAGFAPNALVQKYFKLRAFKMLPAGGHFHINATVDKFVVESADIKTHEKSKKAKDGSTKKIKQYTKEIAFRMPVTMTLEDKDGNILEQKLYNSPNNGLKYSFKNGKSNFNSIAELKKAWEKRSAINNLRKEAIEKAFTEFSQFVKNKYDTQVIKETVRIKVPTGKKVPSADAFETEALKAVEILKSIKADAPLGAAKDDLQAILAFWEAQKDQFSASDKKEKRVHHACLFNLAEVNFYLGNFAEAKKYVDAAVATKEKKGVTSVLLKKIETVSAKAEAQGMSSLNFPIDLSAVVAPEGADYTHLSEFEQAPAPIDNSVSYEGYYLTTKGDSISGTYVFRDGKDQDPIFYSGGNTKFIFEKNGEMLEWYVSPEKFKKGYFNGRLFTSVERRPSVTSLKKINFAVEVIQDGPKMQLIKAFPMEKRKDGDKYYAQTLLEIKGQEGYENVGDLAVPRFMNWKKGFAELFKDCEVLYAEIRVGEYKRNLGAIAKAVRIYNENDCE